MSRIEAFEKAKYSRSKENTVFNRRKGFDVIKFLVKIRFFYI